MINPIGSDTLQPLFVYDQDKHHELLTEAENLPSVVISSQAAGNAVMMGGGYFQPVERLYDCWRCHGLRREHEDVRRFLFPGAGPMHARKRG